MIKTLLLLLLSFSVVYGQDKSKLDSLKIVNQLNQFKKLNFILAAENNIPKAEKFLVSMGKANSILGLLIFNVSKGIIEAYKSNFFDSNYYLFEGLKYAEKVKSKYFLYEIHQNLAINFRQQEQTSLAIINYKSAIDFAQKLDIKEELGLLYNNLGLAFFIKSL